MSATTSVPTGAWLLDYASPLSPAKLAEAKKLGYVGVLRYLAPGSWKDCTPRERDQIFAAGLLLGFIYEFAIDRATKGGPAGTSDAGHALAWARQLGAPDGTLIIFTADTNITAATLPNAVSYFDAADAGARPMSGGEYADWDVINARGARSVCNSMPAAMSWSGYRVHPLTHLRQMVQPKLPGASTDHNIVLRPFAGMWSGQTPAVVPAHVGLPEPTLQLTLLSRFKVDPNCLHLQQMCNFWDWTGLPAGQKIAEDGKFGSQTKAAVAAMQRALDTFVRAHPEYGIDHVLDDGIFGPKTADAVRALQLFWTAQGH